MSTHTTKPTLYGDRMRWGLAHADALLMLGLLPDACIDAICVDPPYGLSFHNESWDGADIYRAVSRDGERLSKGEAFQRWTTRWATECHRLLKPGGHLIAFGAPRTFHRLVCGIEDSGLEIRDMLMWLYAQGMPKSRKLPNGTATALKPAYEPIVLARSPLVGTTQRNLQKWGTGALNTEATRVNGYWPAHVALSHSGDCTRAMCTPDCATGLLEQQRDGLDRLFYCAKASKQEREAGCEQLPAQLVKLYNGNHHPPRIRRNTHRTVKPIDLMRWLVRLITPPGGLVLDPFTGSGTTGIAAVMENRMFLGIEREAAYVDIACARLTHWAAIAAQEEVLP